jgi:hypothetical protein
MDFNWLIQVLFLGFVLLKAIFLLLPTDKIWSQVRILTSLHNYDSQWPRTALSKRSSRLGAFFYLKTEEQPVSESRTVLKLIRRTEPKKDRHCAKYTKYFPTRAEIDIRPTLDSLIPVISVHKLRLLSLCSHFMSRWTSLSGPQPEIFCLQRHQTLAGIPANIFEDFCSLFQFL